MNVGHGTQPVGNGGKRWPATRGRTPAAVGALLVVLCLLPEGSLSAGSATPPPAGTRVEPESVSVPARDPFAPGVGGYGARSPTTVDPSRLELQAILFHPQRSKALVSGRIVGEGDRLFGYTVAEIQPSRVTLQRGQNRHQLFLVLPHERR